MWERRNGSLRMSVVPALDARTGTAMWTYGTIPRVGLMFMVDQVVKGLTDGPVIRLNDSMRGFLRDLGMNGRGHYVRRALSARRAVPDSNQGHK